MQVFCLTSLDELVPYTEDWNRLAAEVPFRSWAWLSTWWRHYGQPGRAEPRGPQLWVPCVFDHADKLVGAAPWYLGGGGRQGRALRMLGSGEVCSDYLSVLCRPGWEYPVTQALASFLGKNAFPVSQSAVRWDLLELSGIDAQDLAVGQLLAHLADADMIVHRRQGSTCWRIPLPATWDEYLAMLSKGHRKQLRRLEREVFETGRATLHSVGNLEELSRAIEVLIGLHQRRRRARGEPGCFAWPRFAAFHREVMPELLRAGQLQLHWLQLDGRPAAAEYHLAAGGVIYAYQSGVDPDRLDEQPGRLATLATVRRAIEHGYREFDFLRGDEPYKAHFRAAPRPSVIVRVVPNRTAALWRHRIWLAGRGLRQWVRSGRRLTRGARDEG